MWKDAAPDEPPGRRRASCFPQTIRRRNAVSRFLVRQSSGAQVVGSEEFSASAFQKKFVADQAVFFAKPQYKFSWVHAV